MASIKEITTEELVVGSLACAGCGGNIALRLALKVLGKKTVIVSPPCCLMGVTMFYPQLAIDVPCVTAVLAGTASTISGLVAGLKRRKAGEVNVVGFAGDGGTLDIGLQALSGAMERGEKFIFICYDNEAYMNTGNQRSGATPYGAYTSTTPGGKRRMWEEHPKKDMLQIAISHNIPYAATACISYPNDYLTKVERAVKAPGPSYIQVLSPCPPGWGIETDQTVEIGRLAVQAGLWPMLEYRCGDLHTTVRPAKRKPVSDYLRKQGRFSLLGPEEIKSIQEGLDARWEKYYASLPNNS
ncbi:MAG: thiamine pyrophosphate-dependent enzyme [Desulfocucumaceae bacterium]